jgi:hypothetical protein
MSAWQPAQPRLAAVAGVPAAAVSDALKRPAAPKGGVVRAHVPISMGACGEREVGGICVSVQAGVAHLRVARGGGVRTWRMHRRVHEVNSPSASYTTHEFTSSCSVGLVAAHRAAWHCELRTGRPPACRAMRTSVPSAPTKASGRTWPPPEYCALTGVHALLTSRACACMHACARMNTQAHSSSKEASAHANRTIAELRCSAEPMCASASASRSANSDVGTFGLTGISATCRGASGAGAGAASAAPSGSTDARFASAALAAGVGKSRGEGRRVQGESNHVYPEYLGHTRRRGMYMRACVWWW